MKKDKEDEMKAKPDRRNLTLSREGEIRAGSSAAKDMSEEDQKRRETFAKLKLDKLKNLDNFIDPCKLMIHNIPKVGSSFFRWLCINDNFRISKRVYYVEPNKGFHGR